MFSDDLLSTFGLSQSHITREQENLLWVKKWNWDYTQAHAFQRFCLDQLTDHPKLRVLILCNHPHVFTNGRGLQKARKGQTLNLVDFNPALSHLLPFPLHQIERGGGLTFHHPGQFVFYPVLKLNPQRLSLSSMIDEIFLQTKLILEDWGVTDLTTENALLGLWHGPQKLASMGIAIEKLTTFHGMALNVLKDTTMENALRSLNPCGLSAQTYTSVEDLISLPADPLETFSTDFMRRISHAWK